MMWHRRQTRRPTEKTKLNLNGIAHESKVGRASLTNATSRQIAKDKELLSTRQGNGLHGTFLRVQSQVWEGQQVPFSTRFKMEKLPLSYTDLEASHDGNELTDYEI